MRAWDAHEGELRGWLRKHLPDASDAEDMLQELFLKALRHRERFCEFDDARAWLFRVARNALTDRLRLAKPFVELPADLAEDLDETPAVASLSRCLPRALSELTAEDRAIIEACDLGTMTQRAYAEGLGISLAATKSRLLRARRRLRERLTEACQVHFDDRGQVCCFVPRDD